MKSDGEYTLLSERPVIAGTAAQIALCERVAPIFKGVSTKDRQAVIEMLMMMHVHDVPPDDAHEVLDSMAKRARQRIHYAKLMGEDNQ